MAARRLKILAITPDLVLGMIQGMDGRRVIKMTGLPTDATLWQSWYDFERRQIMLALEHLSFPIVQDGQQVGYFRGGEVQFKDVTEGDEPVVVQA